MSIAVHRYAIESSSLQHIILCEFNRSGLFEQSKFSVIKSGLTSIDDGVFLAADCELHHAHGQTCEGVSALRGPKPGRPVDLAYIRRRPSDSFPGSAPGIEATWSDSRPYPFSKKCRHCPLILRLYSRRCAAWIPGYPRHFPAL